MKESWDGSIVFMAKDSLPGCDNTLLVRSGWGKFNFKLGNTAMALENIAPLLARQ